MKRFLAVLGVVALLATSATAQDVKPFSFYLGAGASLPNGDFSNAYKLGLHASLGFGFNVAPGLQLVPKAEFHTFSIDKDVWMAAEGATTVDGGNLNALFFGADLKFAPPMPAAPIKPYLFGGGGFARLQPTDLNYENTLGSGTLAFDAQNKFFWNIGAGLQLGGGPVFSFFLQARYLSVSADDIKYNVIPITAGIKF